MSVPRPAMLVAMVTSAVEVVALDLRLRVFNGLGDDLVFDWLVFLHSESIHERSDPVAAESAHQVVFDRNEESGRARVALPTGATPKLVVDSSGFMPFGADDV